MDEETIPCKWCGKETSMLGTDMCDSCWELDTRISRDLDLAERMVEHFKTIKDAEESQKLGKEDWGCEYTVWEVI